MSEVFSDIKGIPVPISTPASYYEGLEYEYVILNSQFLEDDYLLAVEFYIIQPGFFEIYVRKG